MSETGAVMDDSGDLPWRRIAAVVLAIAGVQALALWIMGQPLTCTCGAVRVWSGVVLGPENSQQITDWYTPSHVIHGIAFYYGVRLLFPRLSLPAALALALSVEVAWELLENSPPVIEHYRRQALAEGYSGDTVINSVSDTLAAALGFFLARTIPGWASIAVVAGLELFTGAMIRDGLLLNVIQFVYPVQAIHDWQSGYS